MKLDEVQTHLSKVEAVFLDQMKNTASFRLKEGMEYSFLAGGKRIRPLLLLSLYADLTGKIDHKVIGVATALEMIHTYSLIHDDLPAMDNDDYRRGQYSNHKQFDEATAILAGDALLTDAFVVLAKSSVDSALKIRLVEELASAAGSNGMVAGQMEDMLGEEKHLSLKELQKIHREKTGRLFVFACQAAAQLADKDDYLAQKLGEHLGIAFQIRDDILDVTASFESLGKTIGKDAATEKSTYVQCFGLEGAKEKLKEQIQEAKETLVQLTNERGATWEIIERIEKVN